MNCGVWSGLVHAPGLPPQPPPGIGSPRQGLGLGTSRRSGRQAQEALRTLTILPKGESGLLSQLEAPA